MVTLPLVILAGVIAVAPLFIKAIWGIGNGDPPWDYVQWIMFLAIWAEVVRKRRR